MLVRAAEVAAAFFAGRFTLAAPAHLHVLAHVVIKAGEAVEGAAARRAVELRLVDRRA
jgi:hypothetical protein